MAIVPNGQTTTLSTDANNSVMEFTALDLVEDAFENLRVIDSSLELDDDVRQVGFNALNRLIKWLQAQGFHLWTETEAILPLVKSQEKYQLGPNGDECANADDFQFLVTSQASTNKNLFVVGDITPAPEIIKFNPTSSNQNWTLTDSTLVSDGSSITLTNTTTSEGRALYSVPTTVGNTYTFTFDYTQGTSSGVNISAVDINGTISTLALTVSSVTTLEFTARQTTTSFEFENISTVSGEDSILNAMNYVDNSQGDKVGVFLDTTELQWTNVVFYDGAIATIATALTSIASLGNKVYSFSNIIPRPMSIVNVRFRENQGFTDIPTTKWSRTEYFEQPDKSNSGTLTKWYYSPQLTDGDFYVWSTAASNEQLAYFTYIRPTMINDSNATVPDFPAEWFQPLSYMLSKWLIPKFSVPDQRAQEIRLLADEAEDEILGFDNEDSHMIFTVDHVNR